jgi:hypothetical protein
MDSKAVEGLPYQGILAKSRFPLEPAAPVGSGELTDGHGKAVHQGKGWVVLHQVQESAPDQFLDLPGVRAACRVKVVRCTYPKAGKKWV